MQEIQWGKFSKKHKLYIRNSFKNKMNVAEGSVRAGKTIDNCISVAMELETHPDKIHLASGSSLPNAKLNIGDCNGFGLEHLFKGRCHWGKYKSNEALYISTKTGEKIFVFAGGGKADSYKKILGNSYGIWIATEINEHYDSDNSQTSFIKVAFGRQVASKRPKIYWDLNPSSPKHKIYKNYIDKYKQDGLLGGYNYEHFTINDNVNISAERKKEIESMYDVNSVWYKRDILGIRCVAEGLIYKDFADHPEKYVLTETEARQLFRINHINIGVDFGGNGSANTFVCTGFTDRLQDIIVLEAEKFDGATNPEELSNKFVNFAKRCYNKWCKGGDTYCDSAEQILIAGLRKACGLNGVPTNIKNAKKNPINDRIKLVLKLMELGRFHILSHCTTVIEAFSQAIWNTKAGHEDERLDDGTSDIDTLDATEYSIEPHINELKY